VSADVCQKHQVPDTKEDPCLYCLLEYIRTQAAQGKKLNEVKPLKTVMEIIYQAAKNQISRHMVMKRGTK